VRSRTTPWGMELTCEQCGRRETINPDRGEKETNEDLSDSKQSGRSSCPCQLIERKLLSFVASQELTVRVASQEDLVKHLAEGKPIETVAAPDQIKLNLG
jgi:hypothetical protein